VTVVLPGVFVPFCKIFEGDLSSVFGPKVIASGDWYRISHVGEPSLPKVLRAGRPAEAMAFGHTSRSRHSSALSTYLEEFFAVLTGACFTTEGSSSAIFSYLLEQILAC
jgi:hypothetical protein